MRSTSLISAVAIALLLLAPNAVAWHSGPSHVDVGWSPTPGPLLEPDAVVSLRVANIDTTNGSVDVNVNVTLDGLFAGAATRTVPQGENATLVDVQLTPLALDAGNRTLKASATAGRAAGFAPAVTVWYNATRPPPSTPTLDASVAYVHGKGFRITGTASDPEGIARIEVRTPFGGTKLLSPDKNWSLDVAAFPTRGVHEVVVTAIDTRGEGALVTLEATVEGRPLVIYERVVRTTSGGFLDVDNLRAPPRIRDGEISICSDGRCHGYRIGTQIDVVYTDAGGSLRACASHGETYGGCTFETSSYAGQSMRILWAQAGADTASVRITGYAV